MALGGGLLHHSVKIFWIYQELCRKISSILTERWSKMKIEYYTFYNTKTKKSWFPLKTKFITPGSKIKFVTPVSKIKEKLPDSILSQIMNTPPEINPITIAIETKNTEAIEYVENMLNEQGFDFGKAKDIEVTKDEIDGFEFFFIGLRSLGWGDEIDYDKTHPTCQYEACPVGSEIISPVYLNSKCAGTFSIGKCIDIWNMKVRFILSQKLKEVFESEGVTGLKYKQCLMGHRDEKGGWAQESYEGKYHLTEVVSTISEEADNVSLENRGDCKKHLILFKYGGLTNRKLSRNAISQSDFQMIDRVIVKGRQYLYRTPDFMISCKVLKILMKYAVSDIHSRGIYFKDGLTPVPFD